MILIDFIYNYNNRNFALQMKKILFFTLFTLLLACKTSNSSNVLTADKFGEAILESGTQIVDVRTPAEYEEGHIENAINIDIQGANFDEATKALYKDIPVYVYCLKGVRSSNAASRLRALGFANVIELDGGINAWKDKGLKLVTEEPEKIYANDTIKFEDAIKGDKLVLVDFNATWCGPCKVLQPIVDRIHDERTEDVIVYSIDVDKRSDLAIKYKAELIPLLMLFKNGEILHRKEGLVDEQTLNGLIDSYK